MREYEPRVIYCPQCNRRCGRYDGKSQINPAVKCRNCNKLIVYDINTGKTNVKPVPQRTQGSGMRFW